MCAVTDREVQKLAAAKFDRFGKFEKDLKDPRNDLFVAYDFD